MAVPVGSGQLMGAKSRTLRERNFKVHSSKHVGVLVDEMARRRAYLEKIMRKVNRDEEPQGEAGSAQDPA